MTLTTIGFDADDTLWQNEHFYKLTTERFAALLAEYASPERIDATLLESEKRNLALYGYGIKGFTLSMIETALEVTERRAPASVVAEILAAGREMLRHPVEMLPHVQETLAALASDYRLVMITKGDLFDQERKLAESGLGDFFAGVEIVSEKSASTYTRAFQRFGTGPEQAMMVGNSLKSDVVPAIAAGSWGVYIPHALNWVLEHDEEPVASPRYRRLNDLGELTPLLKDVGRA
jgi:putative hydrolase of the HAD superfamily